MSLPDRILDALDRGFDKLVDAKDAAVGVVKAGARTVADVLWHRHR